MVRIKSHVTHLSCLTGMRIILFPVPLFTLQKMLLTWKSIWRRRLCRAPTLSSSIPEPCLPCWISWPPWAQWHSQRWAPLSLRNERMGVLVWARGQGRGATHMCYSSKGRWRRKWDSNWVQDDFIYIDIWNMYVIYQYVYVFFMVRGYNNHLLHM